MINAAGANLLESMAYPKNREIIQSISGKMGNPDLPEAKGVLTSHSVTIKYRVESSATYNRSMMASGKSMSGFELLRSLVLSVFKQQGIDSNVLSGGNTINIAAIGAEEARELVSETGYFGVAQTSERIFQLAVGIAGGDPSKIDAVRSGVEKGFQDALAAFGGWLPEISHQTYDAVMARLDNWASL